MRRKACNKYNGGSYKVAEDEGSNEPLFSPKLRPCRQCRKLNHNYFHCPSCKMNAEWWGRNDYEAGKHAEALWGVTL